jgi:6-bladed beta-propeller
MRPAYLPVLVLLGLSMIGMGCQEEKAAWMGKIEIVNGVANVSNPALPKFGDCRIVLDEDLSIGEDKGRTESIFSRIGGLAVDDRGNIYAIDSREAVVRVFDREGVFIRTIGRRGQGPGETQYPVFVQVTAQGELAVYDYSVARMVFYSLEGTYLRSKTTPRPVLPIGLDSQGTLIAQYILAPPPLGGKLFLSLDPEYHFERELAREEMGKDRTFDIGRPSCFAALSPNDSIVWGDSREYVLYVLKADGSPVMRIAGEFHPRAITAEEEKEYRQRYAEPLKAGLQISFRGKWPAFSELFVDDEGHIFVKTYERAGEGTNSFYLDVFNRYGVYEAKVALPVTLDRNSVWKNGRVYTVETGEDGSPLIKRLRVTWKSGS